MTFGTFDTFHPGHKYYLQEAKKLWTTLVTVVARDVTVERIKWRPPRDKEKERLLNVERSGISDYVVLGSLTDPYQIILDEKPDILCFWYDQNSFNNEKLNQYLQSHQLSVDIIRLTAFHPEKWKSSLL